MGKLSDNSPPKVSYSFFFKEGGSTAPSALLLHGMSGSAEEMLSLAEALHGAGYNVVLPLLSGHQADIELLKVTTANDWMGDAEEALEELERNSSGPVSVIGLSFGAVLALWLASRFPERVSALVLLSTPAVLRSRRDEAVLRLLSLLPDSLLDKLGTRTKKERANNLFSTPRVAMSAHSIGAGARLQQILRLAISSASKIRCPVLALQDPNDHLVSPQALARLRAKLVNCPFSSVEILHGEHELTIGPKHDEVQKHIIEFLNKVSTKQG